MIDFQLNAEVRSDKGKGASRRLRREKKVPGIMYGAGTEPVMIALDHNEVLRNLAHEAFYSHILTVKIGDKQERAILKDLQRHPAKPIIQHLDLQRVSETEKIRVHVPLHFVGEDVAPGVKVGAGVVSHLLIEVEVLCFPRHLPEFIEVDISGLELGDAIHMSELKVPEGVELVDLAHGDEQDLPVVSIHKPRAAEVEPTPAAAPEGGAAPAAPTPEGES